MKKILAITVLVFAATISFAQTTVKGVLLDSLSKEGVPFATVAVTKEGDLTNFAMTGITEVDGSFSAMFIMMKREAFHTLFAKFLLASTLSQ